MAEEAVFVKVRADAMPLATTAWEKQTGYTKPLQRAAGGPAKDPAPLADYTSAPSHPRSIASSPGMAPIRNKFDYVFSGGGECAVAFLLNLALPTCCGEKRTDLSLILF
jgi:hypothetical protein